MTLYPAQASKNDLCRLLRSRSYEKCRHFGQWPEGSRHFYWFEEVDFKSIVGVEATVYPPTDDEPEASGCPWALHTRTQAGASSYDRREQNELIRGARRRFGGSFYNDWHGKNRYTPVPSEAKTPAGRGVYLVYNYVTWQVARVEVALPPSMPPELSPAQYDPSRTLNNALLPFAVAAIEHFFGQAFRILMRYDEDAQTRLAEQSRKVELREVLAVAKGHKTVEDLVADCFSFQNLSSIHSAFREWLEIDFWSILRSRRRLGKRVAFLDDHLQRLIEHRHGLVHRFEFDHDIGHEEMVALLRTVIAIIDEFVDYLENVRGIKVRDDESQTHSNLTTRSSRLAEASSKTEA